MMDTQQTMMTLDNCTVITVDEQDNFYPQGRVVIQGNRIQEVGSAQEVALQGTVVDMEGALVMPGLINTHTHSQSSVFRSIADDLKLMDWLQKRIWPMEYYLTPQHLQAAARLSYMEYVQGGMTTVADQIYFADAVAEVVAESGMRSFLAASVFSGAGPSPHLGDSFAAAQKFVDMWRGKQEQTHVYPCVGPHAPYSVQEDLMRKIIEYAQKNGLLMHIHISETKDENIQIKQKTGMSPTMWLDSLGFFGGDVLAAHSVHLDAEDMAIYAKHNVAVTHNPVSNLKLVSGIMPLKKMWEQGILVSIGTDGAQSNNSMDLLRDLRTGVLIQKQQEQDATFFSVRQAVRMATIDGARALRFDKEIGSLEKGKRADMIAIDASSPRLNPIHRNNLDNLYSLVCYSVYGADVRDTMVDGQWLMKDNAMCLLDEKYVREQAQATSDYLVERAQRRADATGAEPTKGV